MSALSTSFIKTLLQATEESNACSWPVWNNKYVKHAHTCTRFSLCSLRPSKSSVPQLYTKPCQFAGLPGTKHWHGTIDKNPWSRACTPQDCKPAWANVSAPYLTRPLSSCAALLRRHIDCCEPTLMPLSTDAASSQVCTQAGQCAESRFCSHIC